MSTEEAPTPDRGTKRKLLMQRIMANLNWGDILDNFRRGPRHWKHVTESVLHSFSKEPATIEESLRRNKMYRGPKNLEKYGITTSRQEIIFSGLFLGISQRFDFSNSKLFPYLNTSYKKGSEGIIGKIIGIFPQVKSRRRMYIGGPTTIQTEFNNGIRLGPQLESIITTTPISKKKGGIGLSTEPKVTLFSPEQIAAPVPDEIAVIFGTSLYFEFKRDNLSDEELFNLAFDVCNQNGYVDSYNIEFGFLVEDDTNNLHYYVVKSDVSLHNQIFEKNRELSEKRGDYPFEATVVFAVFMLLKTLQEQPPHNTSNFKVVSLEENVSAEPVITTRGKGRQRFVLQFVYTF